MARGVGQAMVSAENGLRLKHCKRASLNGTATAVVVRRASPGSTPLICGEPLGRNMTVSDVIDGLLSHLGSRFAGSLMGQRPFINSLA